MFSKVPKPSPNAGIYTIQDGELKLSHVAHPKLEPLSKLLSSTQTFRYKKFRVTKAERGFELSNGTIMSLAQLMQYITGGEISENF